MPTRSASCRTGTVRPMEAIKPTANAIRVAFMKAPDSASLQHPSFTNSLFDRVRKNLQLFHFIIGKRNLPGATRHGLQALRVMHNASDGFRNARWIIRIGGD